MASRDSLPSSGEEGGLFSVFSRLDDRLSQLQDPRTKSYPLLQSTSFVVTTTLVYLVIVLYAGPRYMLNRKAIKLKTVIRAYNIVQIFVCTYIVYQSFANGFSPSQSLFTTCYAVKKDPDDEEARNIVKLFYITYLIKLSELVETVFFVLRKKFNQVSTLHLYHHVSTLLFVWYGARHYPGGIALFPIVLNCVVHIIMYTYYLLSNFGPKWQSRMSPIKPYITLMQMAQFVLLIIMSFNLLSPFYCKEGPQGFGYVFAPNILIVFFLFYRFFQRTYVATGHPTPLSKRVRTSDNPAPPNQQDQLSRLNKNKAASNDVNNNFNKNAANGYSHQKRSPKAKKIH